MLINTSGLLSVHLMIKEKPDGNQHFDVAFKTSSIIE
jgi:hypothetical protein